MTRPSPRSFAPLMATLALAAGLSACEEPAPTAVETQASALPSFDPVAPQLRPATPTPQVPGLPPQLLQPDRATPLPPTPVPVITPTPAAIAPATPTPTPTPTETPSVMPSADAADGFTSTGLPGDLAISGPGYFVLATKPNPTLTEDLLFTRNGRLGLKAESAGALPIFRLRHATFDFHVVGFMLAGGTAAGAPEETFSSDHVVLTTAWAGQPTAALALFVDGDRNPEASAKIGFEYTGRMLLGGSPPRGADAGPVQLYVAIAQFADPKGLVPAPGFKGVYRYAPAAGAVTLGVAVSGDQRVVGNANLVLVGKLEKP